MINKNLNKDKYDLNSYEYKLIKTNNIFKSNIFNNTKKEKSKKLLGKKNIHFKVEKEYIKNEKKENIVVNKGRWTKEEHDKFIDGIVQFGTKWEEIISLIKSRTYKQVRYHNQKFVKKLKMFKDDILGIDFTKELICNIMDIINHIKSKKYSDIKNVLKYLSNKCDDIYKIKRI